MYHAFVGRDRKPTVLLVEDSVDEEILVTRALRQSSFLCELLVAHSTDEALDFLLSRGQFEERDPHNPDVIITDLRIGSIGGAALISAIRANPHTRLVPIVVLTGDASDAQVDDVYRRGANSLLIKPMDFNDFTTAVARLVRYWGTLNSVASMRKSPSSFSYPL